MGTLHTVNKSPFQVSSLQSCLAHVKADDVILLIEDGIYGAMTGTTITDAVKATKAKVYVLSPDVSARGVDAAHLLEGVDAVDYDGFVDLAAASDRVQAWL